MTPDLFRPAVVARYGAAAAGLSWEPVGGGFSGAAVWRGGSPDGTAVFALKAWPAGTTTRRLREIHTRVALLSHLAFVPRIQATREGDTTFEVGGRVWDLTGWAAGMPERHTPSAARVAAAAAALAAVHTAWRPAVPVLAPCPAVRRRLRVLADWDATRPDRRRGWPAGPLGDVVRRACTLLPPLLPAARAALEPWVATPVPQQTCVGDVWPEHVLFTGDAVTGLIDFGAVRDDHVGADLARLFGGFPGPDALPTGLAAYRAAGGRFAEPDAFAQLLGATGNVCAAAAWLVRLGGAAPADPGAVASRLHHLLARLDVI